MPSTTRRRPLPALIFLVVLLAVTALVWYRVIHRTTASPDAAHRPCPSPSPSGVATVVLPTPQSVTVVVLNATARSGIASKARDVLVSEGFAVPDQAANDKKGVRVPGVAEIRYGPGQRAAAQLLGYYLPSATLVSSTSADGRVVVALGDKFRRLASQAQVSAALTADHITLRATPSPVTSSGSSGASPAPSPC